MERIIFTPDSIENGGWKYPILDGMDWVITASHIDDAGCGDNATMHNVHEWAGYWVSGESVALQPTLRWVNGNSVNDLYVWNDNADGYMTANEFMSITGMAINMRKGGMVASKRISRLIRKYVAYGWFKNVRVLYLEQDEFDKKVWDGAGVVSRGMLRRIISQVPKSLPRKKRNKAIRELQSINRVEFTIQGAGVNGGQDKGHAIVADDLDGYDFILPVDTKMEVTMNSDKTFVGINFVHGHDDMRLDMQSTINLYPFFDVDYMLECLHEESEVFINGIRTGELDNALNRIESIDSIEELGDWYVMEYFASGGAAMWFASVVRSLIGQHLKRLNHTQLGKMRLPVNGGRYYVMPIGVGQRAGVSHVVNEGECFVDADYGTIWVNDNDWVDHISGVLGGADNDDACWVHQFVDTDGERKVLYWRSPNQLGEYILAKPAAGSHTIEWQTVAATKSWRSADSSKLPARIDTMTVQYQDMVDVNSAGGLGEGHEYSINIMDTVIDRQKENGAVLGSYCNILMVAKAVWNKLPANPPAPLEDVIDASVKTGAKLGAVGKWCKEAKDAIIAGRYAVPAVIHERVSKTKFIRATRDHWLDKLYDGVKLHIAAIETERESLARNTTPPVAVMEAGKDWQPFGIEFRNVYAKNHHTYDDNGNSIFDIEAARIDCEAYLAQFDDETQKRILLGVLYESYMGENCEGRRDGQAWQIGSIVNQTMRALRDIGVLMHLENEPNRVVRFEQKSDVEVALPITVNGVWFNLYRHTNPDALKMSDVAKDVRESYKAHVAKLVEDGKFNGRTFQVECREGRKVIINEYGIVIGYVSKADNERIMANAIRVVNAAHDGDGNLHLMIEAA